MPLDQTAAIARIREVVADLADFDRVFASSESNENALPGVLTDFPSVLIMPGRTVQYSLMQNWQRHTYQVRSLVFCNEAGDIGQTAASASELVVAIIAAMAANVTLGGRVNSLRFAGDSGLVTLDYAGVDYLGFEIIHTVSESAQVNAQAGS